MELVLGLAALATALSSVGAANSISDDPNIIKAEPEAVQTMNDNALQGAYELPESNIGNLGASSLSDPIAKSRPIDRWEYTYTEVEGNNTNYAANDVGIYNYDFSTYQAGDTPLSYNKTIYGAIAQEGDVDYYKFTLYGKANVTITLGDIPAQCDYDLKLYEQGTGLYSAGQVINQIDSSTCGSNTSERISKTLYPNTYYIQVYSYRGYGSPQYTLGLNVSYQRGQDQRISDLKDIGAKGAVWLSDWDPYGIKPSISDSRMPIGSSGSWSKCNHYPRDWSFGSFDTTHFTFPIQTGVYKHAELFIWDDSLRTQMLSFVSQLHDAVEDQINTEQEMQVRTEIRQLATGTVVSIMGFIPYVGTVISIMQIAYDLVSGILDIVCPSEDMVITKTNYLIYLARLKEALTWYYPSGDSRVLSIPMKYNVVKKTGQSTTYPSGQIPSGAQGFSTNYFLTYQPLDPNESFEYTKSKIYVQDPENPITGTIFPIADKGSISLALNQRQATALPTAQSLSLEQTSTVNLNYDGYKWFKFTAPLEGTQTYRFESTGNSEAECDVFNNVVYGNFIGNRIDYAQHQPGVSNRDFAYEFDLEYGHTLYFRVHGASFGYTTANGWRYAPVSGSVVRFTRPTQSSTLSFEATDLGLGYHYGDPIMNTNFMQDNNITIDSAVGVQLGANRVMMHVDMDGDYPVTHFALNFHREIRSISFNAYKDPMRNECALFLKGYDQCGDISYDDYLYGIETDLEWDQTFTYTFDQAEVYCFEFMFDPANDPISYWQRKETVYLGNFVVEFKD